MNFLLSSFFQFQFFVNSFISKLNLIINSFKANSDAETRARLLDDVCRIEQSSHTDRLALNLLDDDALLEVLVTGYHEKEARKYFEPIPNFIFSRDW